MNALVWIVVVVAVFAMLMVCTTSVVAFRRRHDTPILLPLSSIAWAALLFAVATVARAPAVYRPIVQAAMSDDESLTMITADTMATETIAIDTAMGDSVQSGDPDVVAKTPFERADSLDYMKIVPFRDGRMDRSTFDSLSSVRKELFMMRLEKAAQNGDPIAKRTLREIRE